MISWLRRNRGFLIFLLCFGAFRTAVADWNPVPSGSMRPTILEGDVVWVNRLAYDLKLPLTDIVLARLGDPKRGDIVTFNSPKDGTRLIKRLVALPGDRVEMRDEVLLINGEAAAQAPMSISSERLGGDWTVDAVQVEEQVAGSRRTIQVMPRVAARRSFGPIVVPADRFFVLGDNRDNSEDSRFIGLVPRERLIGRAERILVSADITGDWLPRWARIGSRLK